MAYRTQGITVEIGGDTTKLSATLSKVNKEIRNTQSQLKVVNKFLKLDSGNAELMAQKQRILSQAVSETKEKIGVEYFDTETLEMRKTEMFVERYKAGLVKDTSYKGALEGVVYAAGILRMGCWIERGHGIL